MIEIKNVALRKCARYNGTMLLSSDVHETLIQVPRPLVLAAIELTIDFKCISNLRAHWCCQIDGHIDKNSFDVVTRSETESKYYW